MSTTPKRPSYQADENPLYASADDARRSLKKAAEEAIPTAIYDTEKADQELQAHYGAREADYKPAFLYVERGPGAGQLLEVKQGLVVIGRASVSDLRIQHPSISRRHAQVKRVGEQFFVKDLSSQNGTFVNKQRLATEVEMKVGDALTMGNAMVRLRGPMTKGEKLVPPAVQQATPVDMNARTRQHASISLGGRSNASVTDVRKGKSSNALKVAVFAGAVGFGLAAALAFGLVKMMTSQPVAIDKPQTDSIAAASSASERETSIREAINRKMNEPRVPAQPGRGDEQVMVPTSPQRTAPVVLMPKPAAPGRTTVASRTLAVSKPATASSDEAEDASGSSAKLTQIMAPYEKGNAEASLELAKKAGDKDAASKLVKFIQFYDTANDAMVSGNGTVAITNFQKALALDESMSSGWGKYGGEIRRQLANLYTLVGLQYVSNGDDQKAKKAFEGALKHDPNNTRARQNLDKLNGGFNDDEASVATQPGRKVITSGQPAAKKKPQSIDDAFGD